MADLIRVILVDDHAVVRAGLRAVLSPASDIDVVAGASNGRDAVVVAARCPADVIVMDLRVDQLDGIMAMREIVALPSPARVLVLTMHAEEEFLFAALAAVASGYLMKSAVEWELVGAIRALARGDRYVQPIAEGVLAGRVQRSRPDTADQLLLASLCERELNVLRLVAEGFAGPLIGEKMAISAKAVDSYKQRIGEKLGASGRPSFVRFALRVGLLNTGRTPESPLYSPGDLGGLYVGSKCPIS